MQDKKVHNCFAETSAHRMSATELTGGPKGIAGGGQEEKAQAMRDLEEKSERRKRDVLARMKEEDPEMYAKITGKEVKKDECSS